MSPLDTHDRLVAAATKAGVPDTMPSTWGADLQNASLQAENLLRQMYMSNFEKVEEVDLRWTSLCSSFWYEFSLGQSDAHVFDQRGKKATFFDNGEGQITTTTWEQSARAVAAGLSLKAPLEDESDTAATATSWMNKRLYISSFLVSQRDMLDSTHRVQGTSDTDWEISSEVVKGWYRRDMGQLQQGNLAAFQVGTYSRMFLQGGEGDYETVRDEADNVVLERQGRVWMRLLKGL